MKKLIGLIIGGCLSVCSADQVAISDFKGINNNENSVVIDPAFAQDLLNVDVTPGGKSIKKRPGYGLYKTLYTSNLSGIKGGYHFFDSSGNDVQLWASSTSIYGIVADATPTQIVSSATLNSTMDCADTQGSAYCVTSNRDFFIRTNGTTLTSWHTSPLGTMVEATPDRVVVAGVSGNLSTLYVSAANSFTSFTVGPQTTDAFTEVIAAPGSKLTHIRWGCGKLLWWKDQSFGFFAFEDQYAAQTKIISDTIGTFDNTSAIDPGGSVWFRGQEGHIWQYDCSGLIKQSIEITPLVQGSGRRTSNSWTQTTQSDWQAGASSFTATLSTVISAGDVVTSSFNVTENSSASGWGSGTASNLVVGASSITLSTNNSGNITNPDFESSFSGNWTASDGACIRSTGDSDLLSCPNLTPQSGSAYATCSIPGNGNRVNSFQITDLNGTTLTEATFTSPGCTWISGSLLAGSHVGKRVKFRLRALDATQESFLTTADSYILGGNVGFYYVTLVHAPTNNYLTAIDNITNGSSTITSGNFVSKVYDSGMPYSFTYASATWSVNTSTPSFVLQQSTSATGHFFDITASTGQNRQADRRYFRYLSTFTVTGADSALSALRGVQLIAASSGTYFSAWKNAPNWTAWSTFNPTYSNGDGSHAFYTRSSTSPFTVLNSSPAWVAQTANALVATSTGIYTQVIDSFTITSATGTTPTLSDFSLNWFEGSATDQAYMLYFDNAIWTDVAYGTGVSSNTYIFKRDLINDGWSLYNFGAGGMLVQNNHLFFGDVASTSQIFQFGSGSADNGTAITSFWKSKDFTTTDPFLQASLTQIDTFAKKDTGSTLTATYAMDTSTTTTAYSILLSSTTQTVVQSRKLIPSGKTGYTFNLKYGDASASSNWEILGYRISFTLNPYRPSQ